MLGHKKSTSGERHQLGRSLRLPSSYSRHSFHFFGMNVRDSKIPDTARLREGAPLLGPESCSSKPADDAVNVDKSTSISMWSNESFGYVLLLSSGFAFSTMALLVRIATGYHGLPVSTVLFIRGLIQSTSALFSIFFFMDYREAFNISQRFAMLLILRGAIGASVMYLLIFALSLLPMGIHSSIFFLSTFFHVCHVFINPVLLSDCSSF